MTSKRQHLTPEQEAAWDTERMGPMPSVPNLADLDEQIARVRQLIKKTETKLIDLRDRERGVAEVRRSAGGGMTSDGQRIEDKYKNVLEGLGR